LKHFIISLLILAGLLAGGGLVAYDQKFIQTLPSFFYQTILFLTFSTGMIYWYLVKRCKPELFVQFYLLTTALKIMAYGVYAYFFISEDKDGSIANVIFFMITYFSFTALEIVFLYRRISSGFRH
jgi:hypothetical protein